MRMELEQTVEDSNMIAGSQARSGSRSCFLSSKKLVKYSCELQTLVTSSYTTFFDVPLSVLVGGCELDCCRCEPDCCCCEQCSALTLFRSSCSFARRSLASIACRSLLIASFCSCVGSTLYQAISNGNLLFLYWLIE